MKNQLTIFRKADIMNADATVAQSVEQLIRNQQAAGSSPASSSTTPRTTSSWGFLLSFVKGAFR